MVSQKETWSSQSLFLQPLLGISRHGYGRRPLHRGDLPRSLQVPPWLGLAGLLPRRRLLFSLG